MYIVIEEGENSGIHKIDKFKDYKKYKQFENYFSAVAYYEKFGKNTSVKEAPINPQSKKFLDDLNVGIYEKNEKKPDKNNTKTKIMITAPTETYRKNILVFTDGAVPFNKSGANGGIGVYFDHPKLHKLNISENLPNTTNQRSELSAIKKAVELIEDKVKLDRHIIIVSDSEYSIKCLNMWVSKWISNNWKNSKGEDVKNRDLIEPIHEKIKKYGIKFLHVNSHKEPPNNDINSWDYRLWYGNFMADKLASSAVI